MSEPTRIADRYQVHELLGRGGMACVYRVTDTASGRQLALKQLLPAARKTHSASVVALFEHEFHTLKQLSHPRVIAVDDYGVDAGGPFYTMELLDGGDLLARAPAPWRELCALLFDVCSSLALLHSRRLLHRDINPRNIRCTQDGKAKLIDFGAMAPMSSGGAQVVGTPAFTPPETVHRLATDARADLFSLGATFYAALTGELAYPARSFAEVMAAWEVRPAPPSARVPGIPSALDDLILSLISLDPALRPRSAFDVMQRLAAIAGLDAQESVDVSRAYLATPALVGRADILEELRVASEAAQTGRGGGVLVRGAPGAGRSRVLDACAVAAMTQGATVLRATASGSPTRFAVVQALLEDVLDALPIDTIPQGFPELLAPAAEPAPGAPARLSLLDLEESTLELDTLRQAVCRFLLAISRVQGLVVAIDDVERVDPASASVLAALLDLASRSRVLIAMTAETEAAGFTLEALARRCEQRELRPLDRDETQQLLGSLFGDAAHLELLAKEIHDIAAGNPRASMDLAQHLVDTGRIQYASGSWTLPNRLAADDLPRSAEAALHARIDRWSHEARVLAEAQALAFYERFSLGDYRALLPAAAASSIDAAVSELMAEGALICHGSTYSLANRLWSAALKARLSESAQRERHRALVGMYRAQSVLNGIVHHAFAAGMDELGLDTLQVRFAAYAGGVDHKRALEDNVTKLVPSHMVAVRAAHRLG
ncbi:MAG TPA: protein kinase, partial [Polyangiales bacterium]|nr:protein kinase [Polyangiales bacterium]